MIKTNFCEIFWFVGRMFGKAKAPSYAKASAGRKAKAKVDFATRKLKIILYIILMLKNYSLLFDYSQDNTREVMVSVVEA